MSRYLVFQFDVTKLTQEQQDVLVGYVLAQSESCDSYDDVAVRQLCPWCHAELYVTLDGGTECGGDGEGSCVERGCVEEYNPDGGTLDEVEDYVRWYCQKHGVENSLVPYRNDGLTYFDQLAYLVREYHDLPQPKKTSRRLP